MDGVQLCLLFRFDNINHSRSSFGAVRKYNCAQYVPIKKTISALLKIPEYAELILSDSNERVQRQGYYSCYQDGSRFKNSPINQDIGKKYVLQFQVYQDGMGITNPFSANSSMHACGMFYFSLLNIPMGHNSTNSNMHLVAVCNSLDIKYEDGLNKIFECIVDEISEFENHGVDFEVAGKGVLRIYGTMAQFTADNLAINHMFGLIESFSGDFWYYYFF